MYIYHDRTWKKKKLPVDLIKTTIYWQLIGCAALPKEAYGYHLPCSTYHLASHQHICYYVFIICICDPLGQGKLSSSFYRWGQWSLERFGNWRMVAQLKDGCAAESVSLTTLWSHLSEHRKKMEGSWQWYILARSEGTLISFFVGLIPSWL